MLHRSRVLLTVLPLIAGALATTSAQSAGAFTPTGRMTVARAFHTATMLPDGRVLLTGGRVHAANDYQGRVVASAELYDPVTGTFAPTGNMAVPRVRHAAILLPNGRVLVVGADSVASDDRTAELYDPATGRFTRTGDTLSPQHAATATLLHNGKVLIAGGLKQRQINTIEVSTPELYDPLTGTFSATGTFVGPGDGFYVLGGPNSPAVSPLSDGRVLFAAEPFSEVYDAVRQRFIATGAMGTKCGPFSDVPSYIGGRSATLLISGEVLLAGGGHEDCGRFAEAEQFDPSSDTFTLVAPMTRRRVFHTATRLLDNTVLIAGGESDSGFSLITEATAEIYVPSAKTFYVVGSMQKGREGHTATLLQDGRVLLAGGQFYQDVGIFLGSMDTADLYVPTAPLRGSITDGSLNAAFSRR